MNAMSEGRTVFLVRHGQTTYNAGGVYQGASDSPALSDHGKRQVNQLMDYLADARIGQVLSSPLLRARQTLELMLRSPNFASVSAHIRDDLVETSIPEWDGRVKSEIAATDHVQLSTWREKPHDFIAASGRSPLTDTLERTRDLLQTLRQGGESGRLVIAHDHVNRCLLTSLMGVPADIHASLPQKNAALTVLTAVDGASDFSLKSSNIGPTSFASLAEDAGKPRILLVRHGTTEANRNRIYQGSLIDLPLDARGGMQADLLGRSISAVAPRVVISSRLRRARQTVARLKLSRKIPHVTDSRLNEFDYGHWTGLTASEVQRRFPVELRDWDRLKNERPISGAESLKQLDERVRGAMRAAWKEANKGGTVLLVAHDVVIRTAISQSLGLSIEHSWKFPITNGALSELSMASSGRVLLRHHNMLPGRLSDRHDNDFL